MHNSSAFQDSSEASLYNDSVNNMVNELQQQLLQNETPKMALIRLQQQ